MLVLVHLQTVKLGYWIYLFWCLYLPVQILSGNLSVLVMFWEGVWLYRLILCEVKHFSENPSPSSSTTNKPSHFMWWLLAVVLVGFVHFVSLFQGMWMLSILRCINFSLILWATRGLHENISGIMRIFAVFSSGSLFFHGLQSKSCLTVRVNAQHSEQQRSGDAIVNSVSGSTYCPLHTPNWSFNCF